MSFIQRIGDAIYNIMYIVGSVIAIIGLGIAIIIAFICDLLFGQSKS